jgi:hypothetical protein
MTAAVTWDRPSYPAARRDEEHIERYKSAREGSVDVPDPYVWLEDVRRPVADAAPRLS